jgi:predicted acetyltransferase
MPELIAPTTALHDAWLDSRDDWGVGTHQDGSGMRADDEVDSDAGFAAYVERLLREEDPAVPPAEGRVHCTTRWIVEDGRVLGSISMRHELNDFLRRVGGHIGYGIRPSERRRGLASWALAQMLDQARRIGIDRVLLTCVDSNLGSRAVIEGAGGVLESVGGTELGLTRRYWVDLTEE